MIEILIVSHRLSIIYFKNWIIYYRDGYILVRARLHVPPRQTALRCQADTRYRSLGRGGRGAHCLSGAPLCGDAAWSHQGQGKGTELDVWIILCPSLVTLSVNSFELDEWIMKSSGTRSVPCRGWTACMNFLFILNYEVISDKVIIV